MPEALRRIDKRRGVVALLYVALTAGFFHSGLFEDLEVRLSSFGASLGIWAAVNFVIALAEGRWWVLLLSPVVLVLFLPEWGTGCSAEGDGDSCRFEWLLLVFTPFATAGLVAGVAVRRSPRVLRWTLRLVRRDWPRLLRGVRSIWRN